MNLFKPYQALKEIWLVSADPIHWKNQNGNALLGWWWATLIIGNILAHVSIIMIMSANSISSLQSATTVSVLSDLFSIVTTWLLLAIVSNISDMQTKLITLEAPTFSSGENSINNADMTVLSTHMKQGTNIDALDDIIDGDNVKS